jgi:hypothetical protein
MVRWRIAGAIAAGPTIRFRREITGADAALGSLLRCPSRLTLVGDSMSRGDCKPLSVSVSRGLMARSKHGVSALGV